MSKAVRLRTL